MALNLFAVVRRSAHSRRRDDRSSVSSSVSRSTRSVVQSHQQKQRQQHRRQQQQRRGGTGEIETATAEDRRLFTQCVEQVQRQLKPNISSPNSLYTLASYYTREEPYVEGRPFCVSLSYATFLFHIQMARVSEIDVQLYVQLISAVLAQISDDARLTHPFVLRVLRDAVFGLPSPTCIGGAHCVALVPPLQYRAFAYLATSLVDLGVVPLDILYQWHDKLESLCNAQSPLVANRALALLVHTVGNVRMDEQVKALQFVLKTRPRKMNVDFLLACYERLKRAVPEPVRGPTYGRALSIHCSELFLRFRSPIRREYVERFLYPSLSNADMQSFVQIPATRQHLCGELLRQCTPGMSTGNPFYLCLCAIMQYAFEDEIEGAVEVVELINCQMPHAAYFMSTLSIDTRMSVAMFAKVVIALVRGAGLAMTGREVTDDVAEVLKNRPSVYNVLFLLREIVRNCSITASRRATDMLKALSIAVPPKTVETLGKLAMEAFDDITDTAVDPQLLCAELAMVLHQQHVDEAMDAAVAHLRDVTVLCIFCGMGRGASLLCSVNGTMHMTGQVSVARVVTTLAECAGMPAIERKLIQLLRDPATQMDSAVHFLLFHILSHAGQHRNTLFVAVEPYIRSTLMTLVNADRMSTTGLVTSQQKANILMLHVKLVILLSNSIDPSYLESILRVFCEVRLRSNHDALALWYMANLLLRQGKGNVELLPTDPTTSNYCVDYPNCAPTCNTTADNAQLLLKIIDRSHSFSDEMRKLVGCCVCKLIQDFNLQAPNIVDTLLSPFGFVPVGLEPLMEYALPVGASSTFWTFFVHQMKSSAPARTAFMVTLAKCMSQRFRIAAPAEAVTLDGGVERTGHLFAVMMYESMKRNPPLTRVVLHMISQWVSQTQHPPGRFVCLVYICSELLAVVATRHELTGEGNNESCAETTQDARQFEEAVSRAARVVQTQLPRIARLAPLVHKENAAFYALLRRLHRRARRVVRVATGVSTVEEETENMEAYDEDIFDKIDASEKDSAPLTDNYDNDGSGNNVSGMSNGKEKYDLHVLQQPDDDSVFDDYYGDNDAGEALVASHDITAQQQQEQSYTHVQDNMIQQGGYEQDSHHHHHDQSIDSSVSAAAGAGMMMTTHVSSKASVSSKQDQSTMTSPASSISSARSRRPREVSFHTVEDDPIVDTDNQDDHHRSALPPLPLKRNIHNSNKSIYNHENKSVEEVHIESESRGVQTSPEEKQEQSSHVSEKSSKIKEVSAFAANILAPKTKTPQKDYHHHHQNLRESHGAIDDTTWREPEIEYIEGDEEPIENLALPLLQASHPHVDGVAIPSALVLEYLSTHQGSKSVLHELQQFERELYTTRAENALSASSDANRYHIPHHDPISTTVAPPHTTIVPVTVERRPNNYSVPHAAQVQVPSKTTSTT
ncbi:hypothetical protein LSM04_001614 [Trypanosoma melophagium]|uniref:uncharacterized protein n=1 Tax=Trypanosoma melophagium TaxID=715481 RepID=UPI00351A8872|nr:hypothetical protein LSM04_001614 [Trypanosoma melophagium]